ncbi:MAG: RNA polymerase sigma factor [Alphaproteobacteria bacterium]|nr:RNA polymerase sigma factor [Alphaproteobacteria bacterium]
MFSQIATLTAGNPDRAIVPSMAGSEAREADAELMRRVAAGDAAACRFLVDRELPAIIAFAYRMLASRSDAEDVGQECFLRLWKASHKWRPDARVRTWLHRVAHNLCIDRIRGRKPSDPIDAMELAADGPGPSGALQQTQVALLIDRAVAGLPERQRLAVALVHFQEFSNIEAAKIMDVSVEALESLLARGRRALRGALDDLRADLLGEP